MTLPSFNRPRLGTPRIYVLEVRDQNKPENFPIAWLLVEREESRRMSEPAKVREASIRLSYEVFGPMFSKGVRPFGTFSGGYYVDTEGKPCVSLTSSSGDRGAVHLDPVDLRGHRVGTYFMNEIVRWARQWPDATVRPVELLASDAGADNKARRNRFYEQFGLNFDYHDDENRAGLSRPMAARNLTPVTEWETPTKVWKNLRVRDTRDFIGELLEGREQMLFELSDRARAVKDDCYELRQAELAPIRWAFKRVWFLHWFGITCLAMAAFATLFWLILKR